MTFTPAALAFDSIAAPLPESSESTSRTEAPALMSASAWVCMVEALPPAVSIWKLAAGRPAASNAFFRYGASYWTYRVDVVVSGSSTPTMPLPCEASAVSCFIAEKSDVKSVALIFTTVTDFLAAADVVAVEEDVVDELHPEAATTSPKESSAPVSATDLRAVSIGFPFVVNLPIWPCSVSLHRRVHPQPHRGVVIKL